MITQCLAHFYNKEKNRSIVTGMSCTHARTSAHTSGIVNHLLTIIVSRHSLTCLLATSQIGDCLSLFTSGCSCYLQLDLHKVEHLHTFLERTLGDQHYFMINHISYVSPKHSQHSESHKGIPVGLIVGKHFHNSSYFCITVICHKLRWLPLLVPVCE